MWTRHKEFAAAPKPEEPERVSCAFCGIVAAEDDVCHTAPIDTCERALSMHNRLLNATANRITEDAQRMEREITLATARAVGAAIDESKDTVMMSTTTLNYLLVAVAQGRVTIEHLPAFDKHSAPEIKAWIAPRQG